MHNAEKDAKLASNVLKMYFSDYEQHKDAMIRPSLLWEYDLDHFDWQKMRNVVVQRVIERGRPDDYYAMLNLYGLDGVRDAVREIPVMSNKDISFVCIIFDLKKEELKCYTRKQSYQLHWDY